MQVVAHLKSSPSHSFGIRHSPYLGTYNTFLQKDNTSLLFWILLLTKTNTFGEALVTVSHCNWLKKVNVCVFLGCTRISTSSQFWNQTLCICRPLLNNEELRVRFRLLLNVKTSLTGRFSHVFLKISWYIVDFAFIVDINNRTFQQFLY